eukprot:376325_1
MTPVAFIISTMFIVFYSASTSGNLRCFDAQSYTKLCTKGTIWCEEVKKCCYECFFTSDSISDNLHSISGDSHSISDDSDSIESISISDSISDSDSDSVFDSYTINNNKQNGKYKQKSKQTKSNPRKRYKRNSYSADSARVNEELLFSQTLEHTESTQSNQLKILETVLPPIGVIFIFVGVYLIAKCCHCGQKSDESSIGHIAVNTNDDDDDDDDNDEVNTDNIEEIYVTNHLHGTIKLSLIAE